MLPCDGLMKLYVCRSYDEKSSILFLRHSATVRYDTIRYDTIRYAHIFISSSRQTIRCDTVHLRALKSWWDGKLSLAHGTERKIAKNWKQKNE